MIAKKTILVVDDERGVRDSLRLVLEDDYDVVCVESGAAALDAVRRRKIDLALLDVAMSELDGIETLERIKNHNAAIDVIMISAMDRAGEAVASLRLGAVDYITKPFDDERVLAAVREVMQKQALQEELRFINSTLTSMTRFCEIVTCSRNMKEIFQRIGKLAETDSNVLIYGESGTGKELIARAVHANSKRAGKVMVAINCASIPDNLLESELFGYEKGAFTGAHASKKGKIEYADKGTLFLDEISSLKPDFQAKLLRFLQEREFTRVGANAPVRVDVRIVCASNRDLLEMVEEGSFREDLYFRLNVVPVNVPPLRERNGDVVLLCEHFLKHYNAKLGKNVAGFSPEAMDVIKACPWPGNVRELKNLVERIVVLGDDGAVVDKDGLPMNLLLRSREKQLSDAARGGLVDACSHFERKVILDALKRHDWNQTATAKALGVHRNTLIKKMAVHRLKP